MVDKKYACTLLNLFFVLLLILFHCNVVNKFFNRYLKSKEEENSIKIKRSIHDSDVSEYSSGSKHSNAESTEEEEMDYKNGRLEKSLGYIAIQIVNNNTEEDEATGEMADGPSLSQAFSANGKYHMSQLHCIELSTESFDSFKEMIDSRMQYSIEQDLKAIHNTSEALSV